MKKKLIRVRLAIQYDDDLSGWHPCLNLGRWEVREDISSAATNGRDVFFGDKFLYKLEDEGAFFVAMHEINHIVLQHFPVYTKLIAENPLMANAAMDYVNNMILIDMCKPWSKLPIIDGRPIGLFDERFRNKVTGQPMSTKEVYDILKNEQEENKKTKAGEGGESGESGAEVLDHHDFEGYNKLSKEEQKDLEGDVKDIIRAAKILGRGFGGGGADKIIGDLIKPQISWKEKLRNFMIARGNTRGRDKTTYTKLKKRWLAANIIFPKKISNSLESICICPDTSGSIKSKEHSVFMTETNSILKILKPKKVDVIYWGTNIHHESYTGINVRDFINSTKPKEGGGTDPFELESFIKNPKNNIKPKCIVILTDGYTGGDWGNDWDNVPVIWVIVNNKKANPPRGKIVHATTL
jgi:predicted metal-dependent peptidase